MTPGTSHNLRWSLCRFCTIGATVLSCLAFTSVIPAAVTVALTGVPTTAPPGQNISLNVQFTKTGGEAEKRLIFITELRKTAGGVLVTKVTSDNSTNGYTGDTGTVPVSVAVPANATGSHYFIAYAVPWSLNKAMVAQIKTYPTNGTFTYLWSGGGYGVTKNLYYLGSLAAPKPAGNTTYCSGLAFDCFLTGYNDYNTSYPHTYIGNITSASQMETFRKLWYGVTDAEKLSVRAIVDYNIGRQITDWNEAQEGDSCQLWRTSGSGHNPVFINWIRNGSGTITGVRYWGSQGSTNGIGYNTEYFSGSGGSVMPSRFYLGRLAKPRDQADYDWALGQANTQSAPTLVGTTSVRDWDRY